MQHQYLTRPFPVTPPFYGYGAADLFDRPVVGFDTETYALPEKTFKTDSGRKKMYFVRKAPRLVCGSWAGRGVKTPIPDVLLQAEMEGGAIIQRQTSSWQALTDRPWTFKVAEALLETDTVLVAHVAPFDLGVLCAERPSLIGPVFKALQDGRVVDTRIREMLVKIALGELREVGGRRPRFDLNSVSTSYGLLDRSAEKKGEDIWRLRYNELDGVPLSEWPEDAVQYAIDDASGALTVAILQAPAHRTRRTEKLLDITTRRGGVVNELPQLRAAWVLYLKSLWGMRVDGDLHGEWEQEIDEAVSRAKAIGRKAGFVRANGKLDKKALQTFVARDFEARGKPHPLTPKGVELAAQTGETPRDLKYVSVTKDTLLECRRLQIEYQGEKVPALQLWGETAFMLRMRSTYVTPASLGIDFPLHYDYNVLVATGRTSGRNPNMQNPPRAGKFRELFVPRPGMVFSSVDYAAEELRTLAQLHYWWFGRSALREAFLVGEDPHAMFGALLAGVGYATFKTWKRSTDKALQKQFKNLRQAAKAANFGYPGGLGASRFVDFASNTYRVDLAEVAVLTGYASELPPEDSEPRHELALEYARHLKKRWLQQWPEAGDYMQFINGELQTADTFTYVQPVSWRQRGGCDYNSGNNSGFQGLAADAAKEAMWRLSILCYVPKTEALEILMGLPWVPTPQGALAPTYEDINRWSDVLYGCRPVLFIHDEIVVEGPEATAHLWAPAQAEVMSAAAQLFTPDVPQVAEEAIMPRWYKGAEPVWADAEGQLYIKACPEGGKLVPWAPGQTYVDLG